MSYLTIYYIEAEANILSIEIILITVETFNFVEMKHKKEETVTSLFSSFLIKLILRLF